MARIKLTKTAIAKLPAPHPDGKQTLYWDTELTGFGVLCSGKTNAKAYIVQHGLQGGQTRRVTVARVNVLDLEKAREKAKGILAEFYDGKDPKATTRGKAAATLQEVLDAFLKGSNDLRENSRLSYRNAIERHLSDWLKRPMRIITPDLVEERHAEIQRKIEEEGEKARSLREAVRPARLLLKRLRGALEGLDRAERRRIDYLIAQLKNALAKNDEAAIQKQSNTLTQTALKVGVISPVDVAHLTATAGATETRQSGKAAANLVMRVLRALWFWQSDRVADFPANPVRRLKRQWFNVAARERMVHTEDLPKFYAAVDALPSRTAADYIKLLLFTGLRRREAAGLRWDDVDLVSRVIRLPGSRTKSGRKLDLPMSDFVHGLFVTRRALGIEKPPGKPVFGKGKKLDDQKCAFVFASDSVSGHLEEPAFPLRLVAEKCGVRISAHDLRRTFITVAEGTDISPLALKALVNHTLGKNDVTAGYIQMSVERLREPAQRVADRLKELCKVPAPAGGNVAVLS